MIVLRHCESEFNRLYTLTGRDPGIADPPLSARGRSQAAALPAVLAGHRIGRILVSPYHRAIETAQPLARELGLTPRIQPLVRERALYSCDIGSPRSELEGRWPDLDFSGLDENWWTEGVEPVRETERRARAFCAEAGADEAADGETLVVSHWAFLLSLTGEGMENGSWRFFNPSRR
ncbi:histidine phosphatase family protein [Acetobacter sp. AN02]|uniref:histidine phosphatase family protein n=1 Tax=Acetobacter sp. AN02 TaxID=2894186 RepID=UPI00243411FF|nr:histidine phosphatase family protein [Acetobacter sp. AN02]MDG6093592.1 histidine phosphatase family protein [Acetobacter sp. AN02]